MWTKPGFLIRGPVFYPKRNRRRVIGSVLKFILLVFFVKNTVTSLPKGQTLRVS